jgi:hypothetical protein
MNPSIWIYGGVHNDPGSRQRFIEKLNKQGTAPHFVAVEWEQSLFRELVARRSWIVEHLQSRWDFLTLEDCAELSSAFAWEGDAWAELFPDSDVLWLEHEYQEAHLLGKGSNARTFAEDYARTALKWFSYQYPRTTYEKLSNLAPLPEPQTKKELVDRVSRVMWLEASDQWPHDFTRDARWANAICERSAGLENGWIGVVVGWAHAKLVDGNLRLWDLLRSRGFSVNSVRLGP